MSSRTGDGRGELDELTLARARRGDRLAQTALVERHAARVYALVGRLMAGHAAQVDDVAQEALLKALRALPRFDPAGPARLSTWLLTIATRCAIDALRRQRDNIVPLHGSAAAADVSAPAADDPEHRTAHKQLGRRVEAAMAALPDDQRAVLVLRAYHDLDYDEIAAALDIERGTVKSRLSRARSALRAVLEQPTTREGSRP
ncbi:MAG: sigma-70 family RNA polymerase sigma factor [Myxococcales bacterium]|nr:sigma-70 family RNA polymerase sigma factor [Myxococcales bacterium]